MGKLKKFLRKIILKHKFDSDTFLNYYRRMGTHIGKRTIVYEPTKTFIDATRPWMVTLLPCFKKQMSHHSRFDETFANFKNTKPEFDGYEDFFKAARASLTELKNGFVMCEVI